LGVTHPSLFRRGAGGEVKWVSKNTFINYRRKGLTLPRHRRVNPKRKFRTVTPSLNFKRGGREESSNAQKQRFNYRP
jgi:hypothetical protein